MWVELKTFGSRPEADIAKSVLEAAGIAVQIKADDQGGMRPQLALISGVKLLVKQEQASEARKLLDRS